MRFPNKELPKKEKKRWIITTKYYETILFFFIKKNSNNLGMYMTIYGMILLADFYLSRKHGRIYSISDVGIMGQINRIN